MKKHLNIHTLCWGIVVVLYLLLVGSNLVQQGMFLDGITYSAISKNLANNLGDFFHPLYTQTWYKEFYMQPPMFFGVQAIFFKILGDGIATERIFSFVMALLSFFGIKNLWQLFNNESFKKMAWLPALFWIATPIVFWSCQNNMIENMLTVLSIYAVYFSIKSIKKNNYFHLVIAGIMIFFGFLTKGLVALFPLSAIVFYYLTHRNKVDLKKTILYSIVLLFLSIGVYAFLVYVVDGFRENLMGYYKNQLEPSLYNNREQTTSNRFYILYKLALELALPLILIVVLYFFKRGKEKLNKERKANGIYFILIGISGSIPLMITLQQRVYYLVPSIIFYVIGISIIIAPFIHSLIDKVSKKKLINIRNGVILLLLLSIGYTLTKVTKYRKHESKLKDIEVIARYVNQGEIIGCSETLYYEWGTIAYFSRLYNISMSNTPEDFFIVGIHEDHTKLKNYNMIQSLTNYKLLKKVEINN